jgi:hypothetical protein
MDGKERKISISPSWMQEFIRKRGGMLNVAWRLVCMG